MQVAVVTGAYKGLGLEWCKRLAKEDYTVILTARSLEKAEQAANTLAAQGLSVFPKALDITKEESIQHFANWVTEEFKQIDLLVNNAGINSGTRAKGDKAVQAKNIYIENLDKDEMLSMIDVNTISPILLAQSLRPLLKKSAHSKVINIGSWLGSVSIKNNGGNYSYAVSKSALNMMNRAFAFDIKEDGITSVVVNPGWVQTDMGGTRAKFTAQESVSNIISNVVEKVTLEDTGNFFNYDGQLHAW